MGEEKKRCKDCGNLGEPVECDECAGGVGYPCKADGHGQHVHPDMGACIEYVDK